jgi:hypothetical protein
MIMASPVCHLHYFCLTLPLAAGLLASQLERTDGRWPKVFLVLGAVNLVGTLLPLLPGMDVLRDHGSAPFGTLLFWGCGLAALWLNRQVKEAAIQPSIALPSQAA